MKKNERPEIQVLADALLIMGVRTMMEIESAKALGLEYTAAAWQADVDRSEREQPSRRARGHSNDQVQGTAD